VALSKQQLLPELMKLAKVPLLSADKLTVRLTTALQQATFTMAQAQRVDTGRSAAAGDRVLADGSRTVLIPNLAKGQEAEGLLYCPYDPWLHSPAGSSGRVWVRVPAAAAAPAAAQEPPPPTGYKWCRRGDGSIVYADVDVLAWARALVTGRYAGRMILGNNNNFYITVAADGSGSYYWQRHYIPGTSHYSHLTRTAFFNLSLMLAMFALYVHTKLFVILNEVHPSYAHYIYTSDDVTYTCAEHESPTTGAKIPCCVIIIIWGIVCFDIAVSNPQADVHECSFGPGGEVELANASSVRGGENFVHYTTRLI
jgi:hypothetical protein